IAIRSDPFCTSDLNLASLSISFWYAWDSLITYPKVEVRFFNSSSSFSFQILSFLQSFKLMNPLNTLLIITGSTSMERIFNFSRFSARGEVDILEITASKGSPSWRGANKSGNWEKGNCCHLGPSSSNSANFLFHSSFREVKWLLKLFSKKYILSTSSVFPTRSKHIFSASTQSSERNSSWLISPIMYK